MLSRAVSFGLRNVGTRYFSTTTQLAKQATEALKSEITGFETDLYDCKDLLTKLNATYVVGDEGRISLEYGTKLHDIKFTFNHEFEYKEDGEVSENYSESEVKDEQSENDEETDAAFHEFTAIVKNKKGVHGLKIQGNILFNGDCEIDSFIPIANNVEGREISAADLSDDSINSVFDVVDAIGLNNEVGELVVNLSRYHRYQQHLNSLKSLNGFIEEIAKQ